MSQTNNNRKCEVVGCDTRHHARGFCMLHYDRTPERIVSKRERDRRKSLRRSIPGRKVGRPFGSVFTEEERRQRRREATAAWRKKYPERYRLANRLGKQARRARRYNAKVVSRINKKNILNWHTRICGICSKPIEGDFHIDHIIPLYKGGTHETSNLQLAHPFCNRVKGRRLQSEITVIL